MQLVTIGLLDLGKGLSERAGHIRQYEHDEYPVEYARRQVAAAAVLEDIERPLSCTRKTLIRDAHVPLTPRPLPRGLQRKFDSG